MNTSQKTSPDYGNWVSTRLIVLPGILGLVSVILAVWFPLFLVLAVLFLLVAGYFAYARYLFSSSGRNVMAKVRDLVIQNLGWDGKGRILDIGCGSGALIIALAKKYPQAQAVGVDTWGGQWEYSQKVCEANAALEGVAGQVTFRQSSAAKLPFEDGAFDAVVSNLTFHEVNDTRDKKELIREALRVVKPGGSFAFQDLFTWKQVYGEPDELVSVVRGWGVREVELIDTSKSPFLPRAVKLPFMVGRIAILKGKK
jgi:ubiquinone/menaquinone biosynthesis C-methylase UbiE